MTIKEMYEYFQKKAMENNALFQLEIDVTSKCNANCPFCFQGEHNQIVNKEISLDKIRNLLDDLREMGTYYIGFSGGEPFTRTDFIEILNMARNRGFRISLITNGMLLNKKMIDDLEKIGIDRITVSFHSINEENYIKCFGIKDSKYYSIALENISYMIEKKMPVGIAITVTKYNIHDLEKTTNYFFNLGLSENDINYNLLLAGKREIEDLLPTEEEIYNNRKYLSHKITDTKKSLLCSAGTISCSIDSFGNVYPCTFFNSFAGNLYEQNIKDIWEQSHLMKLLRSFKEEMFGKCQKCFIKGKCNLCLATNLNETGNPFIPSENFCKARKARVENYG